MSSNQTPESGCNSASQYKIKSKLINKFFNEPVEALDLRLTKAEEIFSMETWMANPLTEVKQELQQPVKVEIPLDCSEVQQVSPPYNTSSRVVVEPVQQHHHQQLGRLVQPKQEERPPLLDIPLADRYADRSAAAAAAAAAAVIVTNSLPFSTMDIQRVILNPSQGSLKRRSPIAVSPRFSPYDSSRSRHRPTQLPSSYRQHGAYLDPGYYPSLSLHPSHAGIRYRQSLSPSEYEDRSPISKKDDGETIAAAQSKAANQYRSDLLSVSYPERLYAQARMYSQQQQQDQSPRSSPDYRAMYFQQATAGLAGADADALSPAVRKSLDRRISENERRLLTIEKGFNQFAKVVDDNVRHRNTSSPADQSDEEAASLDRRLAMADRSLEYTENPLLSDMKGSFSPPDESSRCTLPFGVQRAVPPTHHQAAKSPSPRISVDSPPVRSPYHSSHGLPKSPFLRTENPNLGSFRVSPSRDFIHRHPDLGPTSAADMEPSLTAVTSSSEVSSMRKESVIVKHTSLADLDRIKTEAPEETPTTTSVSAELTSLHQSWLNMQTAAARLRMVQEKSHGPMRMSSALTRFPHPYFHHDRRPANNNYPLEDRRTAAATYPFGEDRRARAIPQFPGATDLTAHHAATSSAASYPGLHHRFVGGLDKKAELSSLLSSDDQDKKNRVMAPTSTSSAVSCEQDEDEDDGGAGGQAKGKRGRPRKHAPKIPLPPLYVFIRNLLHNAAYNPAVISWIDEASGCFKVNSTTEFAKTWGKMKANRSEEMTYEKMSRAMRYHYGSERHGRKGHLAMVKEKRLYYRFGELAVNWRTSEVSKLKAKCTVHDICRSGICLWTKE